MTDLERAREILAGYPLETAQHVIAEAIADAQWRGMVAEREKVAMWMIMRSIPTGHGDTVEDLLAELRAGVADEMRERIAQELAATSPYYARLVRALPLTPEEPT